jgi:hypothetical protein
MCQGHCGMEPLKLPPEAKQLLACVQQTIIAAQAGDLAARRPKCSSCSGRCHVNGRRCHLLATPFGKVTPVQ